MPRTDGVYTPPAGTKGAPDTTIRSAPYNALVDDLSADANAPRPITAGGTGASNATDARQNLGALASADILAAPTKELPVDADSMVITDSEDEGKLKRVLWSKIKSTLKTYFDTLYAPLAEYLKLSGGTMTGAIVLAGAPTENLHPTTKKYVDDLGATKAGLTANNGFTGSNSFASGITIKTNGFPQVRLTNEVQNPASIFYVDTTTNFARIETYTFAGAVWNAFAIEGSGDSAFKMNGKIAWNKGNLPEGVPADISGSNTAYKVFTGAQLESRIQAVAQAWVPFQAAGYFSTTIVNTGYVWQNATGKPVMITGSITSGGQAIAEISANGAAFEQIAGASATSGAPANFSIIIPPAWFFRFQSVSGTSYSLKIQRF